MIYRISTDCAAQLEDRERVHISMSAKMSSSSPYGGVSARNASLARLLQQSFLELVRLFKESKRDRQLYNYSHLMQQKRNPATRFSFRLQNKKQKDHLDLTHQEKKDKETAFQLEKKKESCCNLHCSFFEERISIRIRVVNIYLTFSQFHNLQHICMITVLFITLAQLLLRFLLQQCTYLIKSLVDCLKQGTILIPRSPFLIKQIRESI